MCIRCYCRRKRSDLYSSAGLRFSSVVASCAMQARLTSIEDSGIALNLNTRPAPRSDEAQHLDAIVVAGDERKLEYFPIRVADFEKAWVIRAPKVVSSNTRCRRIDSLSPPSIMAATQSMRPLAICSRCLKSQTTISLPIRSFSAKSSLHQAAATAQASTPAPLVPTPDLDPNKVSTVSEEQRLIKHRQIYPIGSRRRRAALSSMKDAIPFEQLPYQCFQEARNVLAQDREEKMAQIAKMRKRIANVEAMDAAAAGGEPHKQHRLFSMRRELENLKILADINDPMVKKRFEDGLGMVSLSDLNDCLLGVYCMLIKFAQET